MVHSLFTEKDDWDDELESFDGGWPAELLEGETAAT